MRPWRSAGALCTVMLVVVLAGGCSPAPSPGPPSPTLPSTSSAGSAGVLGVVVPDVVGLPPLVAAGRISSSGFVVEWLGPDPSITAPPDSSVVTVQTPGAGQVGAPGSIVRLATAPDTSGTMPSSPRVTQSGLGLDVATAVCDAQGRTVSPAGWASRFSAGRASIGPSEISLSAAVVTTDADGATHTGTVECTVGGTDITPVLEAFWLH